MSDHCWANHTRQSGRQQVQCLSQPWGRWKVSELVPTSWPVSLREGGEGWESVFGPLLARQQNQTTAGLSRLGRAGIQKSFRSGCHQHPTNWAEGGLGK